MAESSEDLPAKLAEYRNNLTEVQGLLTQATDNDSKAELLNLKSSLESGITLVEGLLKKTAQAEPKNGSQKVNCGQDNAVIVTFEVGTRCRAPASNGTFMDAVIERYSETDLVSVKLVGWGATVLDVRKSDLRPFELSVRNWAIGDTCVAVYSVDNLFYKAKIQSRLVDGAYLVEFLGYGNREKVPIENIKPVPADVKGTKKDPDKPLTAYEKSQLKKKKRTERLAVQQKEDKKMVNSWQKFRKKGRGAVRTGRKKTSIFESPATVEGKVGVVGSGQGMTEFKDKAKFTTSSFIRSGYS